MKKIYTVWANEDSIEGRGRDMVYYYCSNKEAAQELAKKLGPMGCSDGTIKEVWLVDSKADQIYSQSVENVKKQALAKLTKEERQALDLE